MTTSYLFERYIRGLRFPIRGRSRLGRATLGRVNIEAAHFPSLVVPVRHGRAPAWRGLAGFIASAAFHALLLIILLSPAVQNRRHAKPQAHALVITLAAPPQPAAAAAAPAKPLAARATVPKTQAKPATANAAPHPATAAPSEAEVLDD